MKHLTRNHAIRPPMLLVLVVFAMCFVFPNSADAKKFVTIGANATEGDPTDGLDFDSGGGGIFEPDKSIESQRVIIGPLLFPFTGFVDSNILVFKYFDSDQKAYLRSTNATHERPNPGGD